VSFTERHIPPVDVLRAFQDSCRGHRQRTYKGGPQKISNWYINIPRGRDLRRLEAIVGKEGMSEKDRLMLDFADLLNESL